MNFYFFVQIALLQVNSVVGPVELFPPQGNIVTPAPDSHVDEEPSWKAAPQVPLPYHVVNRVTSADTLELQHKTRSHLQLSFSGLGSTVFGRLPLNFYFFVQIALLRVDSVVGPVEFFPPQGNIVASAPDSPVDEEPSWKAAPQVPLPYHVVNRVTSPYGDCLETKNATRRINRVLDTDLLPGDKLSRDQACKLAFPTLKDIHFVTDDGIARCRASCYSPKVNKTLHTILPDHSPCNETSVEASENQNRMSVIRLLLYVILQLHHLECAKLPTTKQIVFPEMLEGRSDNGDKVLRITGELTLNLEKSSILSKNFLLRTYEDSIMKHTYHDGEMLEEELYHDLKHLASVMVSEDDGLQVEGVLGPKLRIKPLVEDRKKEGRTAHVLYEIDDDTTNDNANVGVEWREQLNISGRDDKTGENNFEARPELLVAVDSTFGSKFDTLLKLIKYIVVLINSVNVRYMNLRDPSVRIRLQALEVLNEHVENFLYRVDHFVAAYRSLEYFKIYVDQNPGRYASYDVVFLLTGLDMAKYTGYNWDVQIQGIAYVAGACTSQKVSIGEDRAETYFGVRILAHELAHL
ncbi:hypothetical protein MRX96_056360 [Rhipicephalus microplus]